MAFKVPEKYRIRDGSYASSEKDGNQGAFVIPIRVKDKRRSFQIIASEGQGWEHVSVSLPDRCPTWGEMCKIKGLFWGDEDLVIQLHPPKSDYVNNHPFCLHLWRKCGTNNFAETPPSYMVGIKKKENAA